MPVQVSVDPFDHSISAVDALPLAVGDPEDRRSAYPYPYLRLSGQKQQVQLRIATLENDLVRVQFALDLGGRIVSFYDKTRGCENLHAPFDLEDGGSRGVTMRSGVLLSVGGATDLAPVEFVAEMEDDAATLCLFDMPAGGGLSWHAWFTLRAERSAVDVRVAFLNRTLEPRPYEATIEIFGATPETGQSWAKSGDVVAVWEAGEFESIGASGDSVRIGRTRIGETLAPYQTDEFQFSLATCSFEPVAASLAAAATYADGMVRIEAFEPFEGKLLILTASGTLEAASSIAAAEIAEIPVPSIEGFAMQDLGGEVLLRWGRTEGAEPPERFPPAVHPRYSALARGVEALRRNQGDMASLRAATLEPALRAASLFAQAGTDNRRRQYARAAELLESALNSNAANPLVWSAKAACARHAGGESDASPDLPNAHYLAPLEPVLRAEAFLSQQVATKEPSPLVKPLADSPDAMVDVGCFYLDLGLFGDALRWCDECLRHREVPALHYLAAFALLSGSQMKAEAASHIANAARKPFNPPYPWRETERVLLQELCAAFPEDARIAETLRLLEWGMGPSSAR